MSSFHLRPVSQSPLSSSPSVSPPSNADRSSPFDSKPTPSSPPVVSMSRSRRPMSPSSLRDVDLTHGAEGPPRSYPAPPTGHELMALFPPAPPATLEMKPGSTSGYFRREERAFFAQGDKEIVRVRLEMDLPQGSDRKNGHDKGKGREPLGNQDAGSRPFLPQIPSPTQASTMGPTSTHSNTRTPRGPPIPVPSSSFQQSPHGQHPPLNSQQHNLHSSTRDATYSGTSVTKTEFHSEDDPDDAWRRPIPYAERRRAGKHTKRVIVRN